MSKAMRLQPADLANLTARVAGLKSLDHMRDHPAERARKTQKYGNTKVKDGALEFDSKAEHRRWEYLVLLERAKQIRALRRQVPFELIPAQTTPSGKRIRPTAYVADFVYEAKADGWAQIVEDVKGAVTPEFRLKRKLMLLVHGVEVQEIRS